MQKLSLHILPNLGTRSRRASVWLTARWITELPKLPRLLKRICVGYRRYRNSLGPLFCSPACSHNIAYYLRHASGRPSVRQSSCIKSAPSGRTWGAFHILGHLFKYAQKSTLIKTGQNCGALYMKTYVHLIPTAIYCTWRLTYIWYRQRYIVHEDLRTFDTDSNKVWQ